MRIFKKENQIGKLIKEKLNSCGGQAIMPTLRSTPVPTIFWISETGRGIETNKLQGYILVWEDFDKIIKKTNEIGGKMYRGDVLARSGGKLGKEIPYDCMEGFIARELLCEEEGKSVTRRSTYYSGILAWAGVVVLHSSDGKGSYITVKPAFSKI